MNILIIILKKSILAVLFIFLEISIVYIGLCKGVLSGESKLKKNIIFEKFTFGQTLLYIL